MTANELICLANVLEIPEPFQTASRYQFSAVEALCLLCAQFWTAADQFDLTMKYDRCQSLVSEVVNELAIFLDNSWNHLLDFDFNFLLSPENLACYTAAIHSAGAPVLTIWSFINCTLKQMCHPTRYQHQAYNGHKKYHALKFQALALPNGLIRHLFGPQEGRHNDNHLAEASRIFEKAWEHAYRLGANETTPIAKLSPA
jgi:hypothetical protein